MRYILKITLYLGAFLLLINSFIPNNTIKYSVLSVVSEMYIDSSYEIWGKIEGDDFCLPTDVSNTMENSKEIQNLKIKNVKIIYFQDVDLISCIDNLEIIAGELQSMGIHLALNLDNSLKNIEITGETLDLKPFYEKYSSLDDANNWVSYIVIEGVERRLSFVERRAFLAELRKILPRPFIGFRFSNELIEKDKKTTSNQFSNFYINENYLPGDDDGDFVIVPHENSGLSFKRTRIFIEYPLNPNIIGFNDGHFIN